MADSDKVILGTGSDLQVFWDGTDGHISIASSTLNIDGSGETLAKFIDDGAVELYHNNAKKIETTANGVTVTGRALGAITTVSLGTGTSPDTAECDMALGNDFSVTVASDGCLLSFANEVAGQSGNIHLSNANGQAITVGAEVAINETALTAIATAGVYQLSYYCIGTGNNQVLITVSGALT